MSDERGNEESSNRISRRDFLDGVAISAAGLAAAAVAPQLIGAEAAMAAESSGPAAAEPPPEYPPAATGIAGEIDPVITDVGKIDGMPNPRDPHSSKGGPGLRPKQVRDTGEEYDAVIVGAGASGLAAAKYYRDRSARTPESC